MVARTKNHGTCAGWNIPLRVYPPRCGQERPYGAILDERHAREGWAAILWIVPRFSFDQSSSVLSVVCGTLRCRKQWDGLLLT